MLRPMMPGIVEAIINAVPQSLRDGSYAMGATKSETIKKVVLPAALPGVVEAITFESGHAAREGQVLARLDARQERAAGPEAAQTHLAAEARLAQLFDVVADVPGQERQLGAE